MRDARGRRGLIVGAMDHLHRALEGADHRDVAVVVGLCLELARRRRVDRRGERLGPLLHLEVHVDLEQAQGGQLPDRLRSREPLKDLERALEPEFRVGRGRDREPEVELVRAQVVVRDAGMRVDDLRRAVRVLGVHLRRDQHRGVAKRAGVEDGRDLPDDPLVEQPGGALHQLVDVEAGLGCQRRVRLDGERKARLQEVHQPLVGLVERDRGAVAARADLGLGSLENRRLNGGAVRLRFAPPHVSQLAASLAK